MGAPIDNKRLQLNGLMMWTGLEIAGVTTTVVGLMLQVAWYWARFPARVANATCAVGAMLLALHMTEDGREGVVWIGRLLALVGSGLLLFSVLRAGPKRVAARTAPAYAVLATTDYSMEPVAVEREVRLALVAYKEALVMAHYRSPWHRFACWCGSVEDNQAERALQEAEAWARAVANRSDRHRAEVRAVAAAQPAHVRAEDNFLGLLDDGQEDGAC